MEFGINKHEYTFQRLTKFASFENLMSAHLFPEFAREKSSDYLSIVYMH